MKNTINDGKRPFSPNVSFMTFYRNLMFGAIIHVGKLVVDNSNNLSEGLLTSLYLSNRILSFRYTKLELDSDILAHFGI